jgi:hypothetical protein
MVMRARVTGLMLFSRRQDSLLCVGRPKVKSSITGLLCDLSHYICIAVAVLRTLLIDRHWQRIAPARMLRTPPVKVGIGGGG